jgi:hypothetical protein
MKDSSRSAETTAERRLKRWIGKTIREGKGADRGLARFYLSHGAFFTAAPLARRYKSFTSSGLDTFGQCYASAAELSRVAQRPRLRYAEGLALISVAKHAELLKGSGDAGSIHMGRQLRRSKTPADTFVFATHAWCVDANNCVIDPTWGGGDGFAYLGVVLDLAQRIPTLPVIKDGATGFAMIAKREQSRARRA